MTAFHRDAIRVFRFVRCTFDAATGVVHGLCVRIRRWPRTDRDDRDSRRTVRAGCGTRRSGRARAAPAALDRRRELLQGRGAAWNRYRFLCDRRGYGCAADRYLRERTGRVRVSKWSDVARKDSFPGAQAIPLSRRAGGRGSSRPSIGCPFRLVCAIADCVEHALVAIGGGKDSLVSIEALRAAGIDQTVTWIDLRR